MKQFSLIWYGITISFLFCLFLNQPVFSQKTWLPTTSIDSFPVFCMTSIGDELYAGMVKGGIYKTVDEGATWTACNVGLEGVSPTQIIAKGSKLFAATTYNGVFVSNDFGVSWSKTDANIHQKVFALAVKDNLLFAGTANGLYRSSDDGKNWESIYHGYTSYLQRPIYSLLVLDNQLFAGSRKFLFSTIDNGLNWTADKIGTAGDIRVVKSFGKEIYLGSSADGIYKTTLSALQQESSNWQLLTSLSPDLSNIKALEIANETLVIGVPTKGINMGGNLENTGLPSVLIGSLAYHKGKLYAGTYWDGIWKYDEPTTIPFRIKIPNSFRLYPNPTDELEVNLSYQLSEPQTVQIILLDNAGQQLKVIIKQQQYKGWHQEKIDVRGLASGTYYCVLKDKTGNHTQKLVIVRP